MAKVFCGGLVGADWQGELMRLAVFARAFDDNEQPVGGIDSIGTLPLKPNATATHINKAIVDAAILALADKGIAIDGSDVIFQTFDRG